MGAAGEGTPSAGDAAEGTPKATGPPTPPLQAPRRATVHIRAAAPIAA